MSEVIVRMEMPLNCAVCRCHTDGWCYLLSIQPSECTYDSRPSWCPIIGVLPDEHGRIIDEAVFCENIVKYSHQSTKTIGKALDATPTIIDMTPIVAEGSE